uniref:Uncharacterized protein n=1 Tax=Glossina palpalis gambiensis TaxID=67801 RepID=A0A1B0BSB3_9MUSC
MNECISLKFLGTTRVTITFLSIALNASTPESLILLMISDRSVNQEIITIIFTPLSIIIIIIIIMIYKLLMSICDRLLCGISAFSDIDFLPASIYISANVQIISR